MIKFKTLMAHACNRYPECLVSKDFRIISLFFRDRPEHSVKYLLYQLVDITRRSHQCLLDSISRQLNLLIFESKKLRNTSSIVGRVGTNPDTSLLAIVFNPDTSKLISVLERYLSLWQDSPNLSFV